MSAKRNSRKRGPKPKRLKADGIDWKDALKHALEKPKPEEGWEGDKVNEDGDQDRQEE